MADYPLSTIADLLSLTPQRIRQLVNEGIIPDGKKGKYDLKITVVAYLEYLRSMVKGRDDSKATHEKKKLQKEARLKELAVQKLEGKLVDAADVEREAFNAGRQIRDSITNLSDRLAPLLAVESDPDKVFKIMSEEIRKVLEGAKGESNE